MAATRLFLQGALRGLLGVGTAYIITVLLLGGSPWAKTALYASAVAWLIFIWSSRCWSALVFPPSDLFRWLRRLEAGALAVTALIFVSEGALLLFGGQSATSLLISSALDENRLIPGQEYGFGLHGNRLGYPGQEFQVDKRPGIKRIAVLGNSFAVGPTVPYADNFLVLLENHLQGTEIYNFGVSGAGLREYQHILKEQVWTFHPDLMLVAIFVSHDLTESLPTPRHLDPRRHALYLLLTHGGQWAAAFSGQDLRHQGPIPDRLTAGTLSQAEFRQVELRRMDVCLTKPPKDVQKKWRQAISYLEQIIADCASHKIPVAFVLIPDEYHANREVLNDLVTAGLVDLKNFDLGLPQRRLRDFFTQHDVPCLDLQPAFSGIPGTYVPRNTHWSVRGNHLAAEQIATWLQSADLSSRR